jgi:L-iditol 2-dehydrogenase
VGGGEVAIVDEPIPSCPPGGLLVKTEASGLCSGELMDWYMDRKIPHVLGHEVAGIVVESHASSLPVGSRVFAHHHAPCMHCEMCTRRLYVHCDQWKRTKLVPGGMAEFYGVPAENLTDTFRVDDLRPIDAALIEPLACVVKSLSVAGIYGNQTVGAPASAFGEADGMRSGMNSAVPGGSVAVIGLGVMGLMHMLFLDNALGYEISDQRKAYAESLGLRTRATANAEKADLVFVCPGNKPALDIAIDIANPGATIVLFAPMPPGEETPVNLNRLYFKDVRVVNSYSCGPDDTRRAADLIREGKIRAEQVVSDFIAIDELPDSYQKMKRGEILKPMVVF